ncbi:MAG: ATP-binding cassette domain-containing protein [Gammaproteobacteria bacterium]|nr:ATP-binding cassette domain-containing protein [Gammaproteobacteria bacterium]
MQTTTNSTDNKAAVLQLDAFVWRVGGPISLSIKAGQCLCLWGDSGVGKSMLLRAIADLDEHEGELSSGELFCHSTTPTQWRHLIRLVPPESSWWFPQVADHYDALQDADLRALGLPEGIKTQAVEQLSSGEKQRLSLLRALDSSPRVLLLDEPTANLDAKNCLRVEALIKSYLEKGGACLWVSHDKAQRERVADEAFELTASGLKANGPKESDPKENDEEAAV